MGKEEGKQGGREVGRGRKAGRGGGDGAGREAGGREGGRREGGREPLQPHPGKGHLQQCTASFSLQLIQMSGPRNQLYHLGFDL